MKYSSFHAAKMCSGTVLCISLMLASPVIALAQASDGEFQTGSRNKHRYKAVNPVHAGLIEKDFARCAYQRNTAAVHEMLMQSNPLQFGEGIELIAFFSETKTDSRDQARQLKEQAKHIEKHHLDECLGLAGGRGRATQSRINRTRFRSMMAEEAYLARNTKVPSLSPGAALKVPRYYAEDSVETPVVESVTSLSDCVTFAATPKADALLRTTIGSDSERSAAVELAPVLGDCLVQGQNFKMTPLSIRALVADGMWARYARTEH